jgi:hypothetical protein
MRNEPLRRLSLAVGATGMLALALVVPAFARTNATASSSSDGGSWGDWVAAYPVAALMADVESDDDDLVSDHNDNDDEQANDDDQGEVDDPGDVEDDSTEAAPEAKPAKHHHKHHEAAPDENNDDQANDDDQGENDDQDGGSESDDGGDSGSDD